MRISDWSSDVCSSDLRMSSRAIRACISLSCASATAHGVDHPREALWLRLGGICMLVHAVMVIFIANLVPARSGRVVAALFLIGSAVFAGPLAARPLGGERTSAGEGQRVRGGVK